jgi:hypothetical protein
MFPVDKTQIKPYGTKKPYCLETYSDKDDKTIVRYIWLTHIQNNIMSFSV